jgi:hypothetical protein
VLFDLQGKRRRVVQATYLTLAVLMGGGLVLFGIGGDVSGGLFDAFSDRNTTGTGGNQVIEDRIERNEKRATAGGPAAEKALQELVRDYFSLASTNIDPNTGQLSEESRDELVKAGAAWQRYLKLEPERPDPATAQYATRIYDAPGLNRPDDALAAAQLIADQRNDTESYLNLVKFATLAKNTRIADLAGNKAIELAPKGQEQAVRQNVKALKQPPAATAPQAAG